MKFRKHKGGFSESLQTETEVSTLADVVNLFSNDYETYEFRDLTCDYYMIDNRKGGYSDTFIITAILNDERIVLGFSDGELK